MIGSLLAAAAKAALRERERLDDHEAFIHLRRAARSPGRKLSEVAREVVGGQPRPNGRTQPTATPSEPNLDTGTPHLDA